LKFLIVKCYTDPLQYVVCSLMFCQSKSQNDRQYNRPQEKGQTMIYKTLYRKIKIKKHELH